MKSKKALKVAAEYASIHCTRPGWTKEEWHDRLVSWTSSLENSPSGDSISSGGMMVQKTEDGIEIYRHVVDIFNKEDTYSWVS